MFVAKCSVVELIAALNIHQSAHCQVCHIAKLLISCSMTFNMSHTSIKTRRAYSNDKSGNNKSSKFLQDTDFPGGNQLHLHIQCKLTTV